jgi:hypothetical protein
MPTLTRAKFTKPYGFGARHGGAVPAWGHERVGFERKLIDILVDGTREMPPWTNRIDRPIELG